MESFICVIVVYVGAYKMIDDLIAQMRDVSLVAKPAYMRILHLAAERVNTAHTAEEFQHLTAVLTQFLSLIKTTDPSTLAFGAAVDRLAVLLLTKP